MKFKSLEDQLYVIKRGVDEILPEEQLIKKIEKSMVWKPRVSLKEGLLETYKFFKKNKL